MKGIHVSGLLKKGLGGVIALMMIWLSTGAQTTYLNIGVDNYWMLDRLETRSGRLCDSLFLGAKAESRKNQVEFLGMLQAKQQDSNKKRMFSRVDKFNIQQMISESGEWTDDENGAIRSKKSLFNFFYKTQYNLSYLKTKDFFLIINPVINYMNFSDANASNSNEYKDAPKRGYYRSQDAEFRGWIGKKLGYYMYFTDNAERLPAYVFDYAQKDDTRQPRFSVPGAAYANPPGVDRKTSYTYYLANGYVDFAPIKDKLNVTFGSGKNFIGDGMSSLFLTDFSSNMPYLKVRARVWKLNYETIYLQLTGQHRRGNDEVTTKKFSTVHYISTNVTRWLNLNFFEAVVFARPNTYELSYLNPVALLITTNHYNGAGDKSLIGFGGKMIIAKHLQLYGQVMLNEFRFKEILGSRKWYGNKYGVQAGAKYFDVFGIRNLDAQAELMAVRPYTYSAQDTFANYTNYNAPLADPLGSGFVRFTTLVRFQPFKKWVFQLKHMTYSRGSDTGSANFGNNIFNSYLTAPNGNETYGVNWINGPQTSVTSLSFNASWQVKRNVFFDFGTISRTATTAGGVYPNTSTAGIMRGNLTSNITYFGVRINSLRRDYSFY
jgi:hypothetical protein